jgi:hypothetical protein
LAVLFAAVAWPVAGAAAVGAGLRDEAFANATGSLLTVDLLREKCSAAEQRPLAPAPAAPIPTTEGRRATTPAGEIQGYGLIQAYGMGYGGMITVRFKPVVLFRSGDLLLDIAGLANSAGPAADRRASPKHWSRWRQAGGVYQYAKSDGSWGGVHDNQVWTSPPTAKLGGVYESTGGTGSIATSGSDAVFVRSSFEFRPGGRVVRQGFAGSSTAVEAGGSRTSTVTGARQGPRAGRYSVEGMFLTIAYDDGGRERATFMTHPSDPNIVWVNGVDYVRRK